MSQARSFAVIGLIVLAIFGAVWAAPPTGRTREITGVWLLETEGSSFFEGATLATVRSFDQADAGWLEEGNAQDLEDVLSAHYKEAGYCNVRAFALRFKGKRRIGMSGHLGLWGSRYEVVELMEIKPLPWPKCESPFDWKAGD